MKSSKLCVLLIGCIGLFVESGAVEASPKRADHLGPSLNLGQFQQPTPRAVPSKQSAAKAPEPTSARRSKAKVVARKPASTRQAAPSPQPLSRPLAAQLEPAGWDRSYFMPPLTGEKHLGVGQEYDDPLYVGYQLGRSLEEEYGPYMSLFIAAGVGAVREASQDSTVRTDMIGAFLGTYGRRLLPERERGLNLSIRNTPIGTAFGVSLTFH